MLNYFFLGENVGSPAVYVFVVIFVQPEENVNIVNISKFLYIYFILMWHKWGIGVCKGSL